jgi:hypothetical protein
LHFHFLLSFCDYLLFAADNQHTSQALRMCIPRREGTH